MQGKKYDNNNNDITTRIELKYHTINNISYTQKFPYIIKIINWNIWGLIHDFDVRMSYLIDEIKCLDADIICLQECNKLLIEKLHDANIDSIYHMTFKTTTFELKLKTMDEIIENDLFCITLSKELPCEELYYALYGEHIFGIVITKFNDFAIFNIHLQSGGIFSSNANQKYHVCRSEQLKMIDILLKEHENIFLMGDFNFDLNGDETVWIEKDVFNKIIFHHKLIDVWRTLQPSLDGFTEDTDINIMRYNIKKQKKNLDMMGYIIKEIIFR